MTLNKEQSSLAMVNSKDEEQKNNYRLKENSTPTTLSLLNTLPALL